MANVKLFLSCVSDEFGAFRETLRQALTRPNVEIKIQEDFQALGGDTLAMLEEYVANCDVVVHFVGDMSGSTPKPSSVDDLLKRRPELAARLAEKGMDREALGRLTYTQWEAWLAIGFNKDGAKKNLVIVAPAFGVRRGAKFAPDDASRASQADHLTRLKAIDFYPAKPFTSADNLVARVFGSAVLDALKKADAGSITKPRNLPFASLGGLFAGRDEDLADLHTALLGAKGAPVALYGLGEIGKTRLAIEYAWSREAVYSALLFVSASDGAALNAGLAGLTALEILDLPEKGARDDATKITAVLRWLESNPTWLMILDNVDDPAAVAEVGKLVPRLKGGHVVVTARASNFSAGYRKLEVSRLNENAAAQFLLDRTEADRSKSKDDTALALTLARELGGLALGLEQAGAHIASDRIGFARYLKLWSESRDRLLGWTDETLTGSERNLATTWATSVARLTPESRRLLDRLAFLAPDPVPDSLLDVAVPGAATDADAYEARGGLYAYSLVSGVNAEDGGTPGFLVHRLVQGFARRALSDERRTEALREALEWVNAAFVSDPSDVRNWPILDPLAPHAIAVARTADEAGIAAPTARLFNQLGLLFRAKANYAEAEPLMRRALAIDEKSQGPDHPNVGIDLNNLAALLQATNRLAEAERLFRGALAIRRRASGRTIPGWRPASSISRGCFRPPTASPRPSRSFAAHSRSVRRASGRTIPRWRPASSISRSCFRLPTATPRRRRCIGAHSRFSRRASGWIIPAWRPTSTISRGCSGYEPSRRGRAADAPRARDRRKELRPRSSRCGEGPQQSRGAAPGHEPPRRG